MHQFMVGHLVNPNNKSKIEHIIALPADSLERPTVIITEDGKTWTWGGMYKHFPNTGFYIQVQPALFTKKMLRTLSRAVPTLERQGIL